MEDGDAITIIPYIMYITLPFLTDTLFAVPHASLYFILITHSTYRAEAVAILGQYNSEY